MTTPEGGSGIRYLSGLDWLMAALDSSLRRTTGTGNTFQVSLLLDSRLEPEWLREKIERFISHFPILSGRPRRRLLTYEPYWEKPLATGPEALDFNLHEVGFSQDDPRLLELFEASVNRSHPTERTHVSFHLIQTADQRSTLSAVFDHKLFDAKGGEIFLGLLNRFITEGEPGDIGARVETTAPSGLRNWARKFRCGRVANRRFLSVTPSPPRTLVMPESGGRLNSRYRLFTLDEERTREVFRRATEEAGFLMEMPYLMASTFEACHGLFESMGRPGSSYVSPVTTDVRPAGKPPEADMFFNYASFFLFQCEVEEIGDRGRILARIKRQMYEQAKEKFPYCLSEATVLSRGAPTALLSRILTRSFGRLSSLSFAYLGHGVYSAGHFGPAGLLNLVHTPRVPPPPGLGVFFNVSRGRLNGVITWLEGMMEEEAATRVEEELVKRL